MAVHFIYDLTVLYALVSWQPPAAFLFLQRWGGVLFLLLSGTCVTLGSKALRRGAVVVGCGLLVSDVTWALYRFFSFPESVLIYFGVLHCLGVCMLLWPVFSRLPRWALALIGTVLAVAGLYLNGLRLPYPWLMPLGIPWEGIITADYFPLLPYLGFFLLGAVLGRTFYQEKVTRFPRVNPQILPIRFLTFCGRQSLWIYLLHQPLFSGIFMLLTL
jgi:uncharacterized membrane protein